MTAFSPHSLLVPVYTLDPFSASRLPAYHEVGFPFDALPGGAHERHVSVPQLRTGLHIRGAVGGQASQVLRVQQDLAGAFRVPEGSTAGCPGAVSLTAGLAAAAPPAGSEGAAHVPGAASQAADDRGGRGWGSGPLAAGDRSVCHQQVLDHAGARVERLRPDPVRRSDGPARAAAGRAVQRAAR